MIRVVSQRHANYWLPRLLSISDQVHVAADRSAQKHFAHMLQNSDPEYWNLLVNNLFWFKQCVWLWKQLVFNCYTDFNVEKVNNLWLMLAVVCYAASCMLKKPSIIWYVQCKKRKGKETCKYLCQIGFFFGHCIFSLVWNAFLQMGLAGRPR